MHGGKFSDEHARREFSDEHARKEFSDEHARRDFSDEHARMGMCRRACVEGHVRNGAFRTAWGRRTVWRTRDSLK